MEVFREVTLIPSRSPVELYEWMRSQDFEWSRDTQNEEELRSAGITCLCFLYPGDELTDPLGAALFLNWINNKIFISNIIPRSKMELTVREYNIIADKFMRAVVSKLAIEGKIKTYIANDNIVTIDSVLNPIQSRLLTGFISGANKQTGSSHPMDRDRWFSFVASILNYQTIIDYNLLDESLKVGGFNEEQREQLIKEFDTIISFWEWKNDHK